MLTLCTHAYTHMLFKLFTYIYWTKFGENKSIIFFHREYDFFRHIFRHTYMLCWQLIYSTDSNHLPNLFLYIFILGLVIFEQKFICTEIPVSWPQNTQTCFWHLTNCRTGELKGEPYNKTPWFVLKAEREGWQWKALVGRKDLSDESMLEYFMDCWLPSVYQSFEVIKYSWVIISLSDRPCITFLGLVYVAVICTENGNCESRSPHNWRCSLRDRFNQNFIWFILIPTKPVSYHSCLLKERTKLTLSRAIAYLVFVSFVLWG